MITTPLQIAEMCMLVSMPCLTVAGDLYGTGKHPDSSWRLDSSVNWQ